MDCRCHSGVFRFKIYIILNFKEYAWEYYVGLCEAVVSIQNEIGVKVTTSNWK
jgi:hypothetical protein